MTNSEELMKGKFCLLLDDWFILVAAALLFLFPNCSTLQASPKFWMLIHRRSEINQMQILLVLSIEQHVADMF